MGYRDDVYEAIQIKRLDEAKSGDLDDPNSEWGGRKRIFSQSDVEFDHVIDRKKINPFSSALSASPYKAYDNDD